MGAGGEWLMREQTKVPEKARILLFLAPEYRRSPPRQKNQQTYTGNLPMQTIRFDLQLVPVGRWAIKR